MVTINLSTVSSGSQDMNPLPWAGSQKIFYANGLWWAFYVNAAGNISFRTSSNGTTWSAETQYTSRYTYDNFDIAVSGTTMILVWCPNQSSTLPDGATDVENSVAHIPGTLNSNGTITWGSQTVVFSYASDNSTYANWGAQPSCCFDSSGHSWIAFTLTETTWDGAGGETGSTSYIQVYRSTGTGGTWTSIYATASATFAGGAGSKVVPQTSGKVMLVYTSGNSMFARAWSGSTWGSQITGPTTVVTNGYVGVFCACNYGDTVDVLWMQNTGYLGVSTLTTSFSATLTPGGNQYGYSSDIAMTVDPSNGDIYAFFYTTGSNSYNFYIRRLSGTWDSFANILSSEGTSLDIYGSMSSCAYVQNSNVMVIYFVRYSTIKVAQMVLVTNIGPLTDTGSGSDAVGTLSETLAALTDTSSGSDSLQSMQGNIGPSADAGSGSDALQSIKSTLTNQTDTGSGSDSLQSLTANIPVSADTGSGTDAVQSLKATIPNQTDTGSGADSIANIAATVPNQEETGSGSDGIQNLHVTLPNQADTTAGTDAVQDVTKPCIPTGDAGVGTDSIKTLEGDIPVSDSCSGADLVQSLDSQIVPNTDSGLGSDDLSSLQTQIPVSDTGEGVDAVADLQVQIPMSDSGLSSDALSSLQGQIPIFETGEGDDAVSSLQAQIPIVESGSGSEALSLENQISAADSGLGEDVASLQAQVPVSDLAVGSDSLLVVSPVNIFDSGAGVDSLTIGIAISLSDSGAGSEFVEIQAQVFVTDICGGLDSAVVNVITTIGDVGFGFDAITVMVPISLSDSGLGTDTAIACLVRTHAIVAAGGKSNVLLSCPKGIVVLEGGSIKVIIRNEHT